MTAQMIKGFLIVLIISGLGLLGLKLLAPKQNTSDKSVLVDKESPKELSPVINSETDFADVENKGSVLSLLPAMGTFTNSQNIKVDVELNTNGDEVMGAEVVILYDPKLLSITDQNITAGTLFPAYPVKKVQREGMVRIIGLISDPKQKQFNGKGVLGTITFKAISKGETEVKIDFTLGATNKSNVVKLGDKESGVNYLKAVENAKYIIN